MGPHGHNRVYWTDMSLFVEVQTLNVSSKAKQVYFRSTAVIQMPYERENTTIIRMYTLKKDGSLVKKMVLYRNINTQRTLCMI